MHNILLINDTENSEELALLLGFDLGQLNHQVRAIFPSLEYAIMVLKKDPDKFKFIVIEDYKKTIYLKIHMTNALAIEFEDVCVINIGGRKYERSDMPNIHHFENLKEAAKYIAKNVVENNVRF